MKTIYRGYIIDSSIADDVDILELNGDLVDGCFESVEAAKLAIDDFDHPQDTDQQEPGSDGRK